MDSKGHDLRHGPEFEALYHAIRERFLPGENRVWEAAQKPSEPPSPMMSSRYYPRSRSKPGISSCYCPKNKIDRVKAEQWRMAALALTLSRDAVRRAEE